MEMGELNGLYLKNPRPHDEPVAIDANRKNATKIPNINDGG